MILNHSSFLIFCWYDFFDMKMIITNQKCNMFAHSDRFSFTHLLIFSFWVILIITHSGHWKNYSSNLIMILDTPMSIFQTAKIVLLHVRSEKWWKTIIDYLIPNHSRFWNSKNSKQWMPLKCIVLQSFTHSCETVRHKSQIFWYLDFCHNRFGTLKKTCP